MVKRVQKDLSYDSCMHGGKFCQMLSQGTKKFASSHFYLKYCDKCNYCSIDELASFELNFTSLTAAPLKSTHFGMLSIIELLPCSAVQARSVLNNLTSNE